MKATQGTYVVLGLIVIGLLVTAMYMLSRGFSARDEPTRVEAFIARNLR